MNFSSNKPKINILLVGSSGVGKTSLCQAFGNNFVDGFSYGIGLSKKAKVVELVTDQGTYRVIDAPGLYDPLDEINTQRHASDIGRSLNLSSAPFVICFVICIQQHDMRVKQSDLIMIKTIKRYYNQGQNKFSVIINRLNEHEFGVFSENSHYRKEFLDTFGRDAGVPITEDDILLIHDKFLTHSIQEQKELLTSYVRKFEAGHMSEFERMMKVINEANGNSSSHFMAGYDAYNQKYQNDLNQMFSQQAAVNTQTINSIYQMAQEQQKIQMNALQQMLSSGGYNNMFASAPAFTGNPYQPPQQNSPFSQFMPGNCQGTPAQQQYNASPGNDLFSQYYQQAATSQNNYLNQYLNTSGVNLGTSPYQQPPNSSSNLFGGAYQPAQSSSTDSNSNIPTNDVFGAAGAFVGGAMGVPGVSSGPGNDLYGAAGQFVGGAVTAGCSIM